MAKKKRKRPKEKVGKAKARRESQRIRREKLGRRTQTRKKIQMRVPNQNQDQFPTELQPSKTVKINTRLLQKLINAFGVSGNESEVRALIKKEIKPYVDKILIDKMGNLVASKKGTKGKPKIMLAAHMDEVGLMVKRIESKGFIYCTAIGDVDAATLPGHSVHIKTKKARIHGILTTKEISSGKLMRELPNIEEIVIDTGLSKQELNALGVEIGTYLPLEHESCCMGEHGLIFGKALDDRLGCYILIELAKRLKKNKGDIYYVFTVQEEIGLRGARPSAFTIQPDWGIVVDTTHANDTFAEPSRSIGKGPCLTIKDGEFIGNKHLNEKIEETAKKNDIPLQLEAIELGTTDAATIQTTAGGVPSSALCVPIRNIHTTVGVASVSDVALAIILLEQFLKKPPAECFS